VATSFETRVHDLLKLNHKIRRLVSSTLVALAAEPFFSLVGHAWLHLDILADFLVFTSASIVLQNVSCEFNLFHAAAVEFFKSALKDDFYVRWGGSLVLSLTSSGVSKQTSVIELLCENVLVAKRIYTGEFSVIDVG